MPNVLAKAKHNRKRQAERRKRLKARLAAAVVLRRLETVGGVVRRAATAGTLALVHALPAICTMCGRRRAGWVPVHVARPTSRQIAASKVSSISSVHGVGYQTPHISRLFRCHLDVWLGATVLS